MGVSWEGRCGGKEGRTLLCVLVREVTRVMQSESMIQPAPSGQRPAVQAVVCGAGAGMAAAGRRRAREARSVEVRGCIVVWG